MSIFEKTLQAISPERALKRTRARNNIAKLDAEYKILQSRMDILDKFSVSDSDTEVRNSGYSHGGASRRRAWAKKYRSSSKSAKSDIELNRKVLRERSRDLAMNAPLAVAAVNSTRTNCVGSGLIPKPKIDHKFLGISQDEATRLEDLIKKEFSLWSESTLCDNNDQNTFYELQQIAFSDWLKNGEEIVLIKYDKPHDYMPYQLRIKLVEADRLCNPGSLDAEYDGFDQKTTNGNRIINGVEVDRSGKVVAYHICSKFPGEIDSEKYEWNRIEKRGKKTGNPNILHIFNGERADQYRGVPFLAPVIQTIKQISRYTEAEIMAAVINSIFSLFVKTEEGEGLDGFGGADEDFETEDKTAAENEDDEITLGSGNVLYLKEGESVEAVESKHPSGNFDTFVNAMACHVGAALEIAPEMLLKKFTNNFSASKGALNETWKAFKMRRKWFVNDFCQELYELWFCEAVSKGRIKAPGFFNDPLTRKAYTKCTWNGPAQGHLNPVQEVNAAITKIKNGLSTHEDECASMNGSDYSDNIRTLERENQLLEKAQGNIENGGIENV